MKKILKKLISVILAMVMIVAVFPAETVPFVFAADNENWSYEIENGEVTITDYIGTQGGTIEIPSEIEGYPVTSLEGYLFSYNHDVTSVVIPSSVVCLDSYTFQNAVNVGSIVVNTDNPVYSSSEDGVLFNKDKTELICYPAKHEGTSYEIPDSVKTIGTSAFEQCRLLTNILIPKGVEKVGSSAFKYCSGLTNVTIEYGVIIIGDNAFGNCYNLTSITLPDSVERVGYRAFYNTGDYNDTANWENDVLYISEWLIEAKTSITGNVSIKSGTKGIADEVFSDCENLTQIIIPNTVTTIGEDAFAFCKGLTTVEIPESVTNIGAFAFTDCTSLTSINIPDSVKIINDYLFNNCNSIESIIIPNSVISIGDSAFCDCSGITKLTMPFSAKLHSNSFDDCTNIEKIVLTKGNGTVLDYQYSDYYDAGYYDTPWYISGCSEVILEDGITGIGSDTFRSCDNLTSIIIPDSVKVIGEYAFAGCDGLNELTMPFSAQIKSDAFYSCTNIEKITLTKGDGTIQNYDSIYTRTPWYISGCSEVILKDGINGIGNLTFFNCSDLEKVMLPDSVKRIGKATFYNCEKLKKIYIPDGVTNIEEQAFLNCRALEDITIPESVVSIGNSAFYSCESLEDITIPKDVTSIGERVFSFCDNLEFVMVDKDNTAYSSDEFGVLFDKGKTRLIYYPIGNARVSYKIPESVRCIDESAFWSCSGMTRIDVPKDVNIIGDYGFPNYSNLTLYGYKNSYVETYATENNINFSAYTSKVTFDANGGTSETAEKEVYTDCAIGSLPTAENSDRVFLGWYTELSGSERVTEDMVITEDCTLYAQWGDPITSISIVMPSGVKYYVGDSLRNAGLKLKVNYHDGTTKTINSGFSLTPETLSVSGSQTVTATYGNHSATAKITVLSVQPVSVSVHKLPEKTTYLVGEDFNTKGMKIKVVYNNSTEKIVEDMSLLDIIYDFSSAGDSIVYYTYSENGATVSDYFEVLVYTKPKVLTDSVSTTAGGTITVPVRISSNCGLMGYNISVAYDSEVLTPMSVSQGSAISGGMFNDSIETSSSDSFNVIWSGSEDIATNGTLFNLIFEVNENAVGETTIDLDFVQADTFNESFDDVQLNVTDAVISISNPAFEQNTLIVMQETLGIAGEVIPISFILSNYTDVTATTVKLEYDSENFTFVSAESDNISVRTTDNGSYILLKLNGLGASLNDTEIMTLNFRVKEYIEGEFDFELVYDQSVDSYGQTVVCKSGKVTVTNPAADETASVYGEKVNATVGQKIIVPVKIKNNHGVMGYKLTFSFDPDILSPLSVTCAGGFSGNFAENLGITKGKFDVIWNGNADVTADGDVLYIEFEVLKQGDTTISISYSQGDTFNESWEDVVLNCKNISITIHPSELFFAKTGTLTVVDKTNKFIYGLPVGIASLDSYVSVATGYGFSVSGKIGTGAKVSITKNGEVADTYTVIIFGDVNGDGWYDGTDAVIVSCIVNGMLPQAEKSVLFAADCNRDGTINETDITVLEQAGILLVEVDQTQSVQTLETQSAYIEYADLIVQTVEADFEAEDGTEDQTGNEPEVKELFIIKFIETLLAWIIKLFSVFESVI